MRLCLQGKVEGTVWAGPPGDLIAAAAQLITDEAEFERLFIQKPEDLKKKAKKKADSGGIIQLVDQKRAMNAGIALAKLKLPFSTVVQCLQSMCCRSGKHLLSTIEIHVRTASENGSLVDIAKVDHESYARVSTRASYCSRRM